MPRIENTENGIGIQKTQDTLTGTKGVFTLRVDRITLLSLLQKAIQVCFQTDRPTEFLRRRPVRAETTLSR